MKTLKDAFEHTLRDIYYAEKKLTKAIPKTAEGVSDKALKEAFENHAKETEEHVKLLEKVFKSIDKKPEGEKCDAIEGLIKETESIVEEASGTALNAAVLAAAQAIEHYEIARYGSLREWAKTLKLEEAHDILTKILDQEKAANSKLTNLAVKEINS